MDHRPVALALGVPTELVLPVGMLLLHSLLLRPRTLRRALEETVAQRDAARRQIGDERAPSKLEEVLLGDRAVRVLGDADVMQHRLQVLGGDAVAQRLHVHR